jgi:MFS family permease
VAHAADRGVSAGPILQAIRENELRAEAVGYHAPRFKLLAFVIGGAFSGAAGVLYAMLFGIVPLEAIGFVFSGNVVFATLIGGSGSLYGPLIGSFLFIWLSESMSVVWARWPLLLGVAFVIVVLFFRGGVVEAWTRLVKWYYSRQKPRQILRRADRRPGREPRDRGRRPALDHRAERRRQDHALQPAHRDLRADVGENSSRSARHHGHARPHRIAHLGLARSFQRTNVFPAFSLLENVWVAAFATGRSWNGLLFRKRRSIPRSE